MPCVNASPKGTSAGLIFVQTPAVKFGLVAGMAPGSAQLTAGTPPVGLTTVAPPTAAPLDAVPAGTLAPDPAAEAWPPLPALSLPPLAGAAEPWPPPQPSSTQATQPAKRSRL